MFTLTPLVSLRGVTPLHWTLAGIVSMTFIVCLLGFLKGGSAGISVVAVDLAYPIAGSIFLACMHKRFGTMPPMIVSPVFWGWVLTSLFCLSWAFVQWLL